MFIPVLKLGILTLDFKEIDSLWYQPELESCRTADIGTPALASVAWSVTSSQIFSLLLILWHLEQVFPTGKMMEKLSNGNTHNTVDGRFFSAFFIYISPNNWYWHTYWSGSINYIVCVCVCLCVWWPVRQKGRKRALKMSYCYPSCVRLCYEFRCMCAALRVAGQQGVFLVRANVISHTAGDQQGGVN